MMLIHHCALIWHIVLVYNRILLLNLSQYLLLLLLRIRMRIPRYLVIRIPLLPIYHLSISNFLSIILNNEIVFSL